MPALSPVQSPRQHPPLRRHNVSGSQLGLGDITQSLFSPKEAGPGGIIWSASLVKLIPTATTRLAAIPDVEVTILICRERTFAELAAHRVVLEERNEAKINLAVHHE